MGGELASSAVFFMTYLMILEGFGLPFKELPNCNPNPNPDPNPNHKPDPHPNL